MKRNTNKGANMNRSEQDTIEMQTVYHASGRLLGWVEIRVGLGGTKYYLAVSYPEDFKIMCDSMDRALNTLCGI